MAKTTIKNPEYIWYAWKTFSCVWMYLWYGIIHDMV